MRNRPDHSLFTCDRRWHRPQVDVLPESQAPQPDTSRFLLWLRHRVDILSMPALGDAATAAEVEQQEVARQAIDSRYSRESQALEQDLRDEL